MERGTISLNDNSVHIELANGTVWVTKSEIARLLDVFVQTVSANLREIFKSKELFEHEATRCLSGVVYYNLDVIIALSFRMRSGRCRQFREWIREQIKLSIQDSRKTPLIIQLNGTAFLS